MEAVDESENLLVDCALEQLSRLASHSVLNCCLGLSHITRTERQMSAKASVNRDARLRLFFFFFLGVLICEIV